MSATGLRGKDPHEALNRAHAAHDEIGNLRTAGEAERDQNRKLLSDVHSSHGSLSSQFQDMSNGIAALQQRFGADITALQREVQQMKGQLAEMPQLKAQLAELQGLKGHVSQITSNVQQAKQQAEQQAKQAEQQSKQQQQELQTLKQTLTAKQQAEQQEHQKLQSKADQMAQELDRIKSGALSKADLDQAQSKIKSQADQLAQELSKMKSSALSKDEHNQLKSKAEQMAQELSKMKSGTLSKEEHNQLKSKAENLSQELNKLKSNTDSKNELSKINQELSKLKTNAGPKDEMQRLKVQADSTQSEFNILKKAIYDRGILAPPRTEPIKEESPPVGTIELSSDIFTARLLLRLGFMKGTIEARKAEKEEEEADRIEGEPLSPRRNDPRDLSRIFLKRHDSGGTTSGYSSDGSAYSSESLDAGEFDNVSGINVPEMEVGGPGYCRVACGWPTICVLTLLMQLLILYVMTKSFESLEHCLTATPYVDMDWWLIHISRVLAMLVSGSLMTKDLMDIMNYWMVSMLLEPQFNWEVAVTALSRVVMTICLIVANIFLFMSYTDAGFLWVNMAALVFVAALGADVLEIAKRGVFGYHICKVVTGVSFELTFLSEYPGWFNTVKGLTLASSLSVVVALAVFLFLLEDPPCGADGLP